MSLVRDAVCAVDMSLVRDGFCAVDVILVEFPYENDASVRLRLSARLDLVPFVGMGFHCPAAYQHNIELRRWCASEDGVWSMVRRGCRL
jgi:hypothetical protein